MGLTEESCRSGCVRPNREPDTPLLSIANEVDGLAAEEIHRRHAILNHRCVSGSG